jgi:glycosyltransferase involved in cell wall biosynthesis
MSIDITVVVPAFNASATIDRALESVASQTVLPRAVVVVNDGSTDDTAAKVLQHPLCLRVPVRLISIPNAGVSAARNTGIRASETDLIALLDADDEFCPDHLATAASAHEARPGALVYWAGIERIFDNDSPSCQLEAATLPDFNAISRRHIVQALGQHHHLIGETVFTDLIRGNFICSAVFKRTLNGQLNLFNERLRYAEDRLFYLDMLGKGEGVFTNRCTMRIHRDGHNTSVTTDRSQSMAKNQKVLYALAQARQLESIARHSQRLNLVSRCVDVALGERIYYASFRGLPDTWLAVRTALASPDFRRSERWLFMAKNLARGALATLRPGRIIFHQAGLGQHLDR